MAGRALNGFGSRRSIRFAQRLQLGLQSSDSRLGCFHRLHLRQGFVVDNRAMFDHGLAGDDVRFIGESAGALGMAWPFLAAFCRTQDGGSHAA